MTSAWLWWFVMVLVLLVCVAFMFYGGEIGFIIGALGLMAIIAITWYILTQGEGFSQAATALLRMI